MRPQPVDPASRDVVAGAGVNPLGDREGFAAAYDEHADTLYRFAARRLGASAAEDVVAEAFCAAWRVRQRYDPGRGRVLPWLLGILAKEISRRHRAEEAHYAALARVAAQGGPGPEGELAPAGTGSLRAPLAAALRRLSRADRDVLLLVAWADLPYAEVAQALGVPIGTVRSRLFRARRQLRAAVPELAAAGEDDGHDPAPLALRPPSIPPGGMDAGPAPPARRSPTPMTRIEYLES